MKIITYYISKQIIISATLVTLGLSFLLCIGFSLRFFDYLFNKGVSFIDFLFFLSLLFPKLIINILPISVPICIIIIYNRLTIDHEITVLKSIGLSTYKLAKPALFSCAFFVLITFILTSYLSPLCEKKHEELKHNMKHKYAINLIEPGIFHNLESYTIFIQNREKNGLVKGIFISHDTSSVQSKILFADEGFFEATDSGLNILLKNGLQQEYNEVNQQMTNIQFTQNTMSIPIEKNIYKPRKTGYEELFLTELIDKVSNNSSTEKKWMIWLEIQLRFLTAILIFSVSFIALLFLLKGEYKRMGYQKKLLSAFGSLFLYILAYHLILKITQTNIIFIFINYIFLCTPFFLFLYVLYKERKAMGKTLLSLQNE